MKKRDLERARTQALNTSIDTDALRSRVSKDLVVVRDAYDIGATALEELRKALHSVSTSDIPAKELAYLTKAYADVVKSVVALRDEGRTTIAYHVGKDATQDVVNEPTPSDVTPLSPLASGERSGTTESPKFSPPTRADQMSEKHQNFLTPHPTSTRALTQTPVALNEFLRSTHDQARETEATGTISVRGQDATSTSGLPTSPTGERGQGDPED